MYKISEYQYLALGLIKLLLLLVSISIFFIIILLYYERASHNWDVSILLDGAYKVSQGQLPHKDFFTPFSQLIFTFSSFGLIFFPNTMMGINLGLVLLSLLLSLITYRSISITYNYSNNYKFIMFMICLMLMVPRLLSYQYTWSHAGIYNRLGYGILGVVIITLMPYVYKKTDKIEPLLWVGLLIASLLYIKITYFIVALLFLPIMVILNFNIRHLYFLIISIFTSIIILGITIGWDFLSFYSDLKYLYYISTNGLFQNKVHSISNYFHPFYFISWFLITFLALEKSKTINEKFKILILGFYIFFVDIILNYTINQPYENVMIIIFILCLIGLGHFVDLSNILKSSLKKSKSMTVKKLGLIIGSILIIYHLTLYAHSYTYKFFHDIPTIIKSIIKLDINKKYESKLYANLPLNVKKEINKNSKLLIVGENDDISFSLNLTSPILPILYWHEGQTFNNSSIKIDKRFLAKSLFKNIDIIILETKGVHSNSTKSFMGMYKVYLNKNFKILSNKNNLKVLMKLK